MNTSIFCVNPKNCLAFSLGFSTLQTDLIHPLIHAVQLTFVGKGLFLLTESKSACTRKRYSFLL